MEEFVDNYARQLHPVEVEQVGEERVVEEAEARECDRGTDVRVVATRLHCGRFGLGLVTTEIAAIGYVADDREPPEIRLKGIARRRHDDPYDRILLDLGYGLIRAANVELQVVRGEFSNFKDCFKFCANVSRQITVGKLPAYRFAVPQEPHLLVSATRNIARVASRESDAEHGQQCGYRDGAQTLPTGINRAELASVYHAGVG